MVGVLAVVVAVFAHIRARLVGALVARLALIIAALTPIGALVARTLFPFRPALHSALTADQVAVAVVAAVSLVGAMLAIRVVGIVLDSAVAANQAVVAIVAAVPSGSMGAIRIIRVIVIVRGVPVIDVPVDDGPVDDRLVDDAFIDIGVVVVDNSTTSPVAAP